MRAFHSECIARFLLSVKAQEYCHRNLVAFSNYSAHSGTSVERLFDQQEARNINYDLARGIDFNKSFSSTASSECTHTIIDSQGIDEMYSNMNGLNLSQQQIAMNTSCHEAGLPNWTHNQQSFVVSNSQGRDPPLPQNWALLSESQRTGILYQMNARNDANMQAIMAEQRDFRKMMIDLTQRLNLVESNQTTVNNRLSTEIHELKDIRRNGTPTAEIKVNGIPSVTKLSTDTLAIKILEALKLNQLCNDILSTRRMNYKNSAHAESASTNEQSNVNDKNSTENLQTQQASTTNDTLNFIIKFKSQ